MSLNLHLIHQFPAFTSLVHTAPTADLRTEQVLLLESPQAARCRDMAQRTAFGTLLRGRSVSPIRTSPEPEPSEDGLSQGTGPKSAQFREEDQAAGGWGGAVRRDVQVARRNLRLHERNHSWGGHGLQSLAAYDQACETAEESPSPAHGSPSSRPLHWCRLRYVMLLPRAGTC